MQIQINTDKNINGSEELSKNLSAQLEDKLKRFTGRITRIEVHLSDEDGPKKGVNAKRCLIEARLEGRNPIAVSNSENNIPQAFSGAITKLISAIGD